MRNMKILLVEPEFPIPKKSKNHKNFLPIGLLKLHNYYKNRGHKTKLVRGNKNKQEIGTRFKPDQIMVTSLFTYWSQYVWDTVEFYRNNYPNSRIILGGIYASLMGDQQEFKRNLRKYNAKVHFGVHKDAEKYTKNSILDFSVLNNPSSIDYQIIHTSRGCIHHCDFCGTWKIEPNFVSKDSITDEIKYRKIVFYDNNLLANPSIEDILKELVELKKKKKILWCEAQSGFDVRILIKKHNLARMLKNAGFRYPRIAWDWGFEVADEIKKGIQILTNGGYRHRDIFLFMLYNWEIFYKEMERKRVKCWNWNVQIADCRFRPLDQLFDKFSSRKRQTITDYYIHPNWTDKKVKMFRKNVRRHNICVRHNFKFYSKTLEYMKVSKTKTMKLRSMPKRDVKKILPDAWFPDEIYPAES